ncbi:hypothetical protein BGZ47_002643 [Haplosporangium gracile]|nr:hypothetical protein BGZ47_002643 [Haplosporangium gracile]
MKPSTVLLIHLGQALALLTTASARLEFTIPKELFIGSDLTFEWAGKPSLGTSQQKVVLFKDDEPILILCEGFVSGSGQCSFRLEEKDVNTISRGNYGYYIGLQALDGLTLDRTQDLIIQYREDPAEKKLPNGDIGGDDDNEREKGEEVDNESREIDRHYKKHNTTKDQGMKNKKGEKESSNEEDDDDDDDDDGDDGDGEEDNEDSENDDDDDDDDGGDGDEEEDNEDSENDNKTNEDSENENKDNPGEGFDIDMHMNMDMDDTDEAAWHQPVAALGAPYPKGSATNSHGKLNISQQIATGSRAINANAAAASPGSQPPQPAILHAPVRTKPGASEASAELATKNPVHRSSTAP